MICRKNASLKRKELADFLGDKEEQKKGAPKMPVYPTMFMKTKGEKSGYQVSPTMLLKKMDL
jgi:hypothetical protein